MKVTIKRWHAVAAWTWNAGEDVCGICQAPYDGCPPDSKFPGDDSPVIWGACGHAFHIQCIQKWLASSAEQRCPMCRRPWEYKSAAEGGGADVQARRDQAAAGQEELPQEEDMEPRQQGGTGDEDDALGGEADMDADDGGGDEYGAEAGAEDGEEEDESGFGRGRGAGGATAMRLALSSDEEHEEELGEGEERQQRQRQRRGTEGSFRRGGGARSRLAEGAASPISPVSTFRI